MLELKIDFSNFSNLIFFYNDYSKQHFVRLS